MHEFTNLASALGFNSKAVSPCLLRSKEFAKVVKDWLEINVVDKIHKIDFKWKALAAAGIDKSALSAEVEANAAAVDLCFEDECRLGRIEDSVDLSLVPAAGLDMFKGHVDAIQKCINMMKGYMGKVALVQIFYFPETEGIALAR